MKHYPINLIGLAARRVVVIGGGTVAARKVAGLRAAGAMVTIISPTLSPELEQLAEAGEVQVARRAYRPGDLEGAFLAIAATDDRAVNQAVWEEAERRGCLINVVDDPDHSNFIVPAVVRRGEITLAISTGGASPALARQLRERLEAAIGPEYGVLATLLAELRPELFKRFPPGAARLAAVQRLINSDVLEIIRQDGIDAARARLRHLLEQEETSA
ncbi:MAG: bifunctional precorrin-2 dehydrogenase/sirohydrochlorin ferrochelatase [Anaerolineae bacterium]|nr:bifunctional precorrin-2 dehydrogenase/sirohydrochlorin ferrochelatase [Anaerolineae bacterium]